VKTSTSPSSASAAGAAAARSRSCSQGCCHSGVSSTFGGASLWKGALTTRTESPRSALKPMPCCTSAVSLSSSSADSGVLTGLPLASTLWRWFTTTAALRRRTVPVALRVTRTVRSIS
jgi:hypothetical protein